MLCLHTGPKQVEWDIYLQSLLIQKYFNDLCLQELEQAHNQTSPFRKVNRSLQQVVVKTTHLGRGGLKFQCLGSPKISGSRRPCPRSQTAHTHTHPSTHTDTACSMVMYLSETLLCLLPSIKNNNLQADTQFYIKQNTWSPCIDTVTCSQSK